jgi:hypothetical protein
LPIRVTAARNYAETDVDPTDILIVRGRIAREDLALRLQVFNDMEVKDPVVRAQIAEIVYRCIGQGEALA